MQLFHHPHNLMERKVHIDVIFLELFLVGVPFFVGVPGASFRARRGCGWQLLPWLNKPDDEGRAASSERLPFVYYRPQIPCLTPSNPRKFLNTWRNQRTAH
jgi:hypothetical protein